MEVKCSIVKHKIPYNTKYAIMRSRNQKSAPSSGKIAQNRMITNMRKFIEDCFIKGTHSYITDKVYEKKATKKSCRWCPFLNTEHCDAGVTK